MKIFSLWLPLGEFFGCSFRAGTEHGRAGAENFRLRAPKRAQNPPKPRNDYYNLKNEVWKGNPVKIFPLWLPLGEFFVLFRAGTENGPSGAEIFLSKGPKRPKIHPNQEMTSIT